MKSVVALDSVHVREIDKCCWWSLCEYEHDTQGMDE